VSFHYRETCGWIPIELIQEYLTEAQRAKGVIDACLKLRESQHVHESVWRKIYKKASPEPEIAARREALIQRHAAPCYGLSTEHNIQQYHLHWNSSPEQGVRFGWSLLIDLINYHIAKSGGLAPCLVDDSTRQGPQLRIAAQWGFLPAVWSEIAQTISGVHQFYCCDECRRFYQRTGRKPKEGQNNYCPGCREAGHKGSKKDSKARKRLRRKDV